MQKTKTEPREDSILRQYWHVPQRPGSDSAFTGAAACFTKTEYVRVLSKRQAEPRQMALSESGALLEPQTLENDYESTRPARLFLERARMAFSLSRAPLYCAIGLFVFYGLAARPDAHAQEAPEKQEQLDTQSQGGNSQQDQIPGGITAVPNRPTFASTAEMVQLGVFEIEYGLEATNGHQNINGLLKWGAVTNLELWFLNNPIERDSGTAGVGDSGAGFKYKLFSQEKARPTLAFLYVATIPTAPPELGAGAMQHLAQLLVSKDFGRHHFDFNEGVQFVGRPGSPGFDHTYFTALSYSHPLTAKWAYTAEIAGFSRANAANPASMTILAAPTYAFSSRLVFDGGAYVAAYGNFPCVTFFFGLTYSVADLYHRHRTP